jgi:hypothetical protein
VSTRRDEANDRTPEDRKIAVAFVTVKKLDDGRNRESGPEFRRDKQTSARGSS